ncbi:MAG TPA: colicin immunity domain-containing protein [Methylomirabilota bacterium]|nr:colicin immunity domain-containing protein [Methylomirabilota bacterium]
MTEDELHQYFSLIEAYIARQITATQFEKEYLAIFKADNRRLPETVFNVLNRLFSDVDDFVENPELRSAGDLDELLLLARAKQAYQDLTKVVKSR